MDSPPHRRGRPPSRRRLCRCSCIRSEAACRCAPSSPCPLNARCALTSEWARASPLMAADECSCASWTGAPFLIVETPRKETHYVRVDRVDGEQLRVGERVRISSVQGTWLTAPDQAIARAAAAHPGIYDPRRHERDLVLRPVLIEGRRVPPESIVAANVRRLERLERYNLVTRNSDGNWKVPPNLVDILRDRERTHPQHRIEIERLDRPLERGRSRGRDLGR